MTERTIGIVWRTQNCGCRYNALNPRQVEPCDDHTKRQAYCDFLCMRPVGRRQWLSRIGISNDIKSYVTGRYVMAFGEQGW